MKITGAEVIPFAVERDSFVPGGAVERETATQTLTRITTDEGTTGYCLGGHGHGDRDGLTPSQRTAVTETVESVLVGEDPFDREKFWRWMWSANLDENVLSVVDMALWDLQGRALDTPVHKLAGGCRERVKAYASTFPNVGSPEEYADHAAACKRQGYTAYKIHPYYFWDPETGEEVPGRPSHVEHDLAVCRRVRERVGDEMTLMYDPWGTYGSYEEALRVGRELEALDFAWYEHPMSEYRPESYVELSRELDIPVLSPEIAAGSIYTRADWIQRGASDMSRIDALRGGITGCLKMAAVCEAYNVRCEIHMSGFANLQVLAATSPDTCEYYERGLVAPGIDYETPPPYLEDICDPLDDDGYVRVPQEPGLGYQLDMDYVEANRTDRE
jgi:L-alanine-DL-glutamate epimerase-like enolase superfamily enzyme